MKKPLHEILIAVFAIATAVHAQLGASAKKISTAWKDGQFHVNVEGVIGRSDIVFAQPNIQADQAVPLGNGRLGAAIWSADGLTAQLNRADTLPDRLSPGQIVIPGLAALASAPDYSGRLDLYNGEFVEHGGGMTATAYVQPKTDTLIVDVTGANPDEMQTARLLLWAPRTAHASANGTFGMLSQTWLDDKNPGFSGRPFGSLSAITVDGRDVSAAVSDPLTVTISFKPHADGHYRVIAAAPHYNSNLDAAAAAGEALAGRNPGDHKSWWNAYWRHLAVIKVSSEDGAGDYMENLRNIYLFAAAAEKGDEYPGSQAGVADMLSSGQDSHHWDSSAFWHWNLRMQVAANIGAGVTELNAPYFNLYRENLPSIENWTKKYMDGRPGACIAETMRFNGQGIEYESSWETLKVPGKIGRDCDLSFPPYYNARTLSTGAEVSLWVWRQYLATNDREFLADNFAIMAASARFLLAYEKTGRDGLLHTSPSNAHETQWDVTDPTTDLAAAKALYPATIQAAQLLGKDADLVRQLKSAIPKIPPLPRTQLTRPFSLLTASADADGSDMIAESYLPGAENHNAENIGLEPIWPYGLIGDSSPLFALARRTYEHRLFSAVADWSFDPIQAARLELGGEVGATLVKITERSQHSVNGLANWDKQYREFYVEQVGVVADALQEAFVQDYDGVIRIAPAIPPGWDFEGSVFVRGKTKVDVQIRNGAVTTAVIEAGTTGLLQVRNPWPGQPIEIVSGRGGAMIAKSANAPVIKFHADAGTSYLIEKRDQPFTNLPYAEITGTAAASARKLGNVQIGLFKAGP